MSLLSVQHVCFAYGSHKNPVWAVNDVSFEVERGRTLGIVGASGSGKSTLAEIVGGLQKPVKGHVLFEGKDMYASSGAARRALRRSVQFVFQDPLGSMEPNWTVSRIMREPLDIFEKQMDGSQKKELCAQMLDRVGLSASVINKKARELSGGQCQRIAIARALVLKPQILICDECTSALDVLVQAQILNLLHDIQESLRCSYIFIGHSLGAVANISHDIMVMQEGNVVEQGPREQVLTQPRHEATRALLEAAGVADFNREVES